MEVAAIEYEKKIKLWESFTGKKVIVIHIKGDWTPRVETSIVVGCHPDIGICLQDPGADKPWYVAHGKLSPLKRGKGEKPEVMDFMFDQIRSGYFSVQLVEDKIREVYCLNKVEMGGVRGCPFNI